MKVFFCTVLLMVAPSLLADLEIVKLGNEPWPPYVLSGEQKGTAELIVCEALKRAGWGCDIRRGDWEEILKSAMNGNLDGIAAAWHSTERASALLYSRAYLTNRLVPVFSGSLGFSVEKIDDLSGLRVVTEVKVAYGDEIMTALERLDIEQVKGVENALNSVQSGKADVALVDELSAREYLGQPGYDNLSIGSRALAFRELYFAVSRKHPRGAEIINSFNAAYQTMLKDGAVNRILDIDWVVTDLKFDGIPDFIYRGGEHTLKADSSARVYPVGQNDYQMISQPGFTGSNANFQVNGTKYDATGGSTNSSFMNKKKCFYDNSTARIVCPTK